MSKAQELSKQIPQNEFQLEDVNKVLGEYFSSDQFDEYIIKYMSEMIHEDRPETEQDLNMLLGDYLTDQLKYTEDKTLAVCKEINVKLHQYSFKASRKALLAERLEKPIRLDDIKVGSGNTITSLNFDPNDLTFEVDRVYAQGVHQLSKKQEYVADKEKIKLMEKHMEEMQKQKEMGENIAIHHGRDENHRVDLISPNFTIQIGGKTLIDDGNLKISFGRRYVLIGRNGVGKTTLLNHIMRKEIEGVPKHIQVVHVEQEVLMTENPLLEEVLSCDVERTNLLNDLNTVNTQLQNTQLPIDTIKALSVKLVDINKRLEEIEANEAERKAKEILFGLGFHEEDFTKKTKDFSGGWRVRISLAKALFIMPDLLLLDEPTNHLDMNAVMWLEDYLNQWPYTLILVSHARDFINNIATDIIHFTNQKLFYYKGNYEDFDKSRTERIKLLQRQKAAQTKKIEHTQEFIDRFRANAKRASLVQSRIKAMNKIEQIEVILEDPTCIFLFPNPDSINPPVLRLDNVDLGYNGKAVIQKINLSVDMSSRIALVGANGCGKTTLLKGLNNILQPMNGLCYRHNKLRLAVFAQHHIDQLDLELSPVEQIERLYPELPNDKIRGHLSSFGISGNLALRPNYLLSGGQKSRVALASIVINNPQILLMDEPTNHLDIDAVNALAIALNAFTGGLLIISHDQHFVESVCNQIYVIENKICRLFKGSFAEYRNYLRAQVKKK